MLKQRHAFTLVELLIVIAVIGILTTIGILGVTQYQTDARDSQRATRATIISEALEKYYDAHGEYPSCSQITQSPEIVSESVLVGISVDVLKTPKGTGENSITCDDLTAINDGDYFAYTGDTSDTCAGTNGSACVLYVLKYIKEASKSVAELPSRHQTLLNAFSLPTLAISVTGFDSATGNWNAIPDATNYQLQYSTTLTFPAVTAPNTASAGTVTASAVSVSSPITGLSYNTPYYFRVRAINAAAPGTWSGTQNATTWSIGTPTITYSGNTLNSMTPEWTAANRATSYTLEHSADISFANPTTISGITGTSRTVSGLTSCSFRYNRVKGVNGAYSSNWSAPYGANIMTAPSTPTVAGGTETSTSVAFTWGAQTCATAYEYQYRINNGSWSGTQSTASTSATITSSNGAKIDLQVRVVNPIGTSAWSSAATGYLIPTALSVSTGTITTTTAAFSWNSIPNVLRYDSIYQLNNGAWSAPQSQATNTSITHGPTTQGTIIGVQVRAVSQSGQLGPWSSVVSATLLVSTPNWNNWEVTYSYPNINGRVYQTSGAALCPAGTSIYSQYRDGVYNSTWSSWRAITNNGGSASTPWFTTNFPTYTDTLQMQIQGYCRNDTTGAVSSTIGTSVRTAQHTPPVITLAAASSCHANYSRVSNSKYEYGVRFQYVESSYNFNANTSNVYWSAYRTPNNYVSVGRYDETLNGAFTYNVTIDGQAWTGQSRSGRWRGRAANTGEMEHFYGTNTTANSYAEGNKTVTHNADGTKSIGTYVHDGYSATFYEAGCSTTYGLADLRP